MAMRPLQPRERLDIGVIENVAPNIAPKDVIGGVTPFVDLTFGAIVLCCVFPDIAAAFPDALMGAPGK